MSRKRTAVAHDLRATCYLRTAVKGREWINDILNSIPEEFKPTHFAVTERSRRTPKCEIRNAEAFDRYLKSAVFCTVVSSTCVFELREYDAFDNEIYVYGRTTDEGHRCVREWLPRLDQRALRYAYAGTSGELDHRNGYSFRIRGGTRPGHGWLGRNHDRYVPGLYWLNYFSREYATERKVDIISVADRAGGKLTELDRGWLLELYPSPESWWEKADEIDEVLEGTSGFFAKRPLYLPELLEVKEVVPVTSELWRKWP
jgi:hypothetical protein